MTFSKIGRIVTALVASAALGLGMTACGGGTIGYMWVLGTYYNQISGFKIDDYTGNLTSILHSPFNSGGTNPVMLAVKQGGRFLYVVNAGTGSSGTPNTSSYVAPQGASIDVFSVGGGGELAFQYSYNTPYGFNPIYLTFDSTGNYLYVLDKYSPNYCAAAPCTTSGGTTLTQTNLNGSITAYSVASDTGELTVVPNTTVLNPNGTSTYFFEVGQNPIMTKVGSGNCLYTLSPTSIFPYVVSGSTGGLTLPTTGPLNLGLPGYNGIPDSGTGSNFTSINTSNSGTYTFITDSGFNQVLTLQGGGTPCTLQQVAGSQQANPQVNAIPINSLTSANGKFLYVINNVIPSTVGTTSSSISAFTINPQGLLQTLSDGTNNPYAVGAGPVCIVEDPSSQYLYTSNNLDSTVSGKLLDQNRGFLSNLTRGSVFPTSQNPTCLAVSGNI
jgi:6-phosphogluconolactonase (cycloisomerase 2 family)